MPAYGILKTNGFATPDHWVCVPVDVKSTGEKTPIPSGLFKRGDVIKKAYVHVRTAEVTAGTKTISVGIDGSAPDDNATGLLNGVSTATVGLIKGTVTLTAGANETFLASSTVGALLQDFLAGANVVGDVGTLVEKEHIISTDSANLTYTLGSAHTELVADIYVLVGRIPGLFA